jgi:hypothetical protein
VPRINRRALAVLAVSICAAAPVRGQTLLSQTTWGGPSFEVTEGLALASDAGTWGGAGLDAGGGVDVAADGSIALGATAEAPPYSLLSAPTKVSRPRGTLGVAVASLADAGGVVSDPAGAVGTPDGSTTFAGDFDAALVRVAP